MVRMIGKTEWYHRCRFGCCVRHDSKGSVKQKEKAEWTEEAETAVLEHVTGRDAHHLNVLCQDPKSGMMGCSQCYDDDLDDAYDNWDLDSVPGVSCDVEMRRKLWIDDLRPVPDFDWIPARTSEEAIQLLEIIDFEEISFDHDLGGDDTTRRVVLWMIENDKRAEKYNVHSANPVGVEWLEGMIERYLKDG